MDFLNLEQALEILKSHKITSSAPVLRRWLREGRIKADKSSGSGSWQIPRAELEEFISLHQQIRNDKKSHKYNVIQVRELLGMKSRIKIPWFQRNFVWPLKLQAAFISTLVIYGSSLSQLTLAEDGPSNYLIVDGKQRLETVYRYFQGKFKLPNDKRLGQFSGKGFSELSNDLQKSLLDANINITVLRNYSFDELAETFIRLNDHTPIED